MSESEIRSEIVRRAVMRSMNAQKGWTSVEETCACLLEEFPWMTRKLVSYACTWLAKRYDVVPCYVDNCRIPRSKWAYQTYDFVFNAAIRGYHGFYPRIESAELALPLIGTLLLLDGGPLLTQRWFTRQYLRGCDSAFSALWPIVRGYFTKSHPGPDGVLRLRSADSLRHLEEDFGYDADTLTKLVDRYFVDGGLFTNKNVNEARPARYLVTADLVESAGVSKVEYLLHHARLYDEHIHSARKKPVQLDLAQDEPAQQEAEETTEPAVPAVSLVEPACPSEQTQPEEPPEELPEETRKNICLLVGDVYEPGSGYLKAAQLLYNLSSDTEEAQRQLHEAYARMANEYPGVEFRIYSCSPIKAPKLKKVVQYMLADDEY